jgi:oxygen-independent coproporphyrinogen III oxidase
MAGIYIHVPFCRSACNYCDFYFTVDLRRISTFGKAVGEELVQRKDELFGIETETIYFGGGTPSLLSVEDIAGILNVIAEYYALSSKPEITLEANPEDLSSEYISSLGSIGINRLSIGIQTFNDQDLILLNRAHTGLQARNAVFTAQEKGIRNLSIDLIYGLPGSSREKLEDNLKIIKELQVPHFSAYHLTYETGTILEYKRKKEQIRAVSDEEGIRQFEQIRDFSKSNGYLHYEISNYAREGYTSRHNSSYWQGKQYLGAGPGAHSFDGKTRRWNKSNLYEYLRKSSEGTVYWESEVLRPEDQYNEYLMTRLRTMWGIEEEDLYLSFGTRLHDYFKSQAIPYLASGQLVQENACFRLSEQGQYIADRIISDLFYVV